MAQTKNTVAEYILEPRNEFRFETENECTLSLRSGKAEIFGTELSIGRFYKFGPHSKIAVTSFHGCTIHLTGKYEEAYVSKEISSMILYLNLHAALEQIRERNAQEEISGPRILVAGSVDVGKSTLCRMLANWASRSGREPVFIDLDVGQNQVTIPGAIGALLVQRPSQPDDNCWYLDQPVLSLHYGYTSPDDNVVLYKHLIDVLAMIVNFRCEANNRSLIGGVIINTCGWIQGKGYDTLIYAAKAFEVDIIAVVDHERLYNRLIQDLPDSVKILLCPKSGGVVTRSQDYRANLRASRIREYFYGPRNCFYPHSFDLQMSDISIYKIGVPQLPNGCLPIGMRGAESEKIIVPYTDPISDLLNHVLSVSYAKSPERILSTNVAGFLVVTSVNTDKQSITVLSPKPLPLPNNILLYSSVRFVDMN